MSEPTNPKSGLIRESDPAKRKFLPMFERYEPVMQDHSAMKLFKNCPRQYFYRMVLGKTAPSADKQYIFDFGTYYHKFREIIDVEYKKFTDKGESVNWPYILMVAMQPVQKGYKPDLSRASKKDQASYSLARLTEACYVGFEYAKKEKEQGKFEVVAIEQPFNVEMPDGSLIGGRADCIVRWGGKLWDRDYKTTTKNPSFWRKSIDPNDQPTRYIYGFSVLHGEPIGGAIFELLVNEENKKPYIAPQIITKSRWQLTEWEQDQLILNQVLTLYREADHWPKQENMCSWCEFQKVCEKTNEVGILMELKKNFITRPWKMEEVEQKEVK